MYEMRCILVILIIFPSLSFSICPSGSFEMPKAPRSKLKTVCFIVLGWAETATLRALIIKDRPNALQMNFNAYEYVYYATPYLNDILVYNKSEAIKVCENSGKLSAFSPYLRETYQRLVDRLYAKNHWDLAPEKASQWEKITNTGIPFRMPTQTKREDMEELVKFMNNRWVKVYKRTPPTYNFFMEAPYEEATTLGPKASPKWNYMTNKGCTYYEVTNGIGAVHSLDCTKAFPDAFHPNEVLMNFTQMIICEFDAPDDCEMTWEIACFTLSNKVCKMYNKTIFIKKGNHLGKPCPPVPVQPAPDQLPDCNADTKQCTRNCQWYQWSDWGDCDYGVDDVSRMRSVKQEAWFGGEDCPGPNYGTHCCMIDEPLSPCTTSKITQSMFIILIVMVPLSGRCLCD